MTEQILLVGCCVSGCEKPATWKAGTWWFCVDHIGEYTYKIGDRLSSYFGTVYEHGTCKSEDYWIGEIPLDMTVSVAKDAHATA